MSDTAVDPRSVLGAVLAGGRSHRMGRDKAMLEIGGQPMIRRPLDTLSSVLGEVIVVAPRHRPYRSLGAAIVPDIEPLLGPVGGLRTALAYAAGRPVFVLACDMPWVNRQVVELLLRLPPGEAVSGRGADWSRRAAARVPVDGGRPQPLCGLYGAGCLAVVERALGRELRSMFELLEELETERLPVDRKAAWYHPHLFTNVNDGEDYARLEPGPAAAI